jgi:hypothetical protein
VNLLIDNRLGAEDLQLAVFKTMQSYLNTYVAEEEQRGLTLDAEIAAAGGNALNISIEQFDPRYIHYGHRPSMIEAPVTEYPSMSVMAYAASPASANSSADYGHSITLRCAVEFIVKSGPYDPEDRDGVGEDIVGRRAKRTAEAIHRLMQDHAALDGKFMPPEAPPIVTIGDIFEREEDGETVTGARWYWQGVRIEFIYLKQTVFGTNY